jgi:hypothetical protein
MAKRIECFLLLCIACTGCAGPTLLYYDHGNADKLIIGQHHNLIDLHAVEAKANETCTRRGLKAKFIYRDFGCNLCFKRWDYFYYDCVPETNTRATQPIVNDQMDKVVNTTDPIFTKCKEQGFEELSQKFTECLKRIRQ